MENSTPSEEMVALYSPEGFSIGAAPRSRVRRENLHHAATAVLVFNEAGQIFVHQRTQTKDVYPGLYDFAAGGVLQAGEDPWEAAGRELKEELGLSDPLHRIGEGEYSDHHTSYHGFLAWTTTRATPVLQPEEVLGGSWWDPAELLARIEAEPALFMPDTVGLLAEWLREHVGLRRGPARRAQEADTPAEIRVRLAHSSDAATVRSLTLAFDPRSASLDEQAFNKRFASTLASKNHLVVLVEHRSVPVGYALAQDYGPDLRMSFSTGRLQDLFVLPEARKRGLGAVLMDRVAEWARSRHPFILDWQASPGATEFYERLGYTADRTGDYADYPGFCLDTRTERER